VATQAEASLKQRVNDLLERLDAMDLDAVGAMVDDQIQGVDEIARRWMRGRPALEGYLSQLKPLRHRSSFDAVVPIGKSFCSTPCRLPRRHEHDRSDAHYASSFARPSDCAPAAT